MKISVILPVALYNTDWLSRAIESTRDVADELIIVTDEGAEFKPECYNNPLVHKVLVAKFPGVVPAINAGIAVADGDYISILCSDDYYLPGAIKITNRIRLKNARSGIIGGVVQVTGILGETKWPTSGNINNIENENCIPGAAFFLKHLWWEENGFDDKRYADWHFWKKCIRSGADYEWFSDDFYTYFTWPGTISASYGYRSDLGHEWEI